MGNNETNEYPFGEYKFNDNFDEKEMKVHLVTTNTMIILMEKMIKEMKNDKIIKIICPC